MPTHSFGQRSRETNGRTGERERIDGELRRLIGTLLVGGSVALLDTTVVAVAIPELIVVFDAGVAAVQWTTSAYLLSMVAVIPLIGWLTDCCGARSVWLGALVAFLAGSVLCSLAWSIEALIAARVVQGLGGGLVVPMMQAILAGAAGPHRFGRVMALVAIPGQAAPILGPVVGASLVAALGWRGIFLVNVPMCLLAIGLGLRNLPADGPRRRRPLDRTGALLLAPALISMLAGLATLGEGILETRAAMLLSAVGAVTLLAFVLHAVRRGETALLDLGLLRHPTFLLSVLMVFLSGACLFGPLLLLPLFFHEARGLAAAELGWMLAPQGMGAMVGLWLAGFVCERVGPRLVGIVSALLSGTGLLVFILAADASLMILAVALVALGAGLGGIGVAVATTSYRDVDHGSIPMATGLINVVQRIGAACGTVVVALVLAHELHGAAAPSDRAAVEDSFSRAFAWMLAFVAPAAVLVLFFPRAPAARSCPDGAVSSSPDSELLEPPFPPAKWPRPRPITDPSEGESNV